MAPAALPCLASPATPGISENGRVSDPFRQSLPWLDVAQRLWPAGRYLAIRHQVLRRIKNREFAESMRQARILIEQTCLLHGRPQEAPNSSGAGSLWCGCEWRKDVVYARNGTVQHVIRVARRDPDTGTLRVASFADTGGYPGEDVLDQVRDAFG